MNEPKAGEIYQHFKGGKYCVIGVAKHSETLERMVVYMNHKKEIWIRPLTMWNETVVHDGNEVPRYKKTGEVESWN